MKWWINLLTLLVSCSAESSQCPGSKASCPMASTCCQIGEGIFGCCPIQNAVCCEDSKHCCPRGYSCDVNRGVCKMGSKLAPLLKKILATPTSNEIASKDVVVCPGGEGQCPTDHSCCTVPGGNQLHCCPLGYSCDRGMCRETEVEFPAAMLITSPDKVVKCSQQFACPDRYTCCTRDSYQCCPLPEAVCCSDNKHCCPRGFKCSDDGKSCLSGSHSIVALSTATPKRAPKSLNKLLQQVLKTVSKEWLSRTVTEQVKLSVPMTVRLVEKVICPGGESFCPSGQTCCKVASGQWGCCPLSRAVCCSDGVHCCPHDYTCDLAKQTCERNRDSIAILTNTAALKSGRIICPDHISECPDNNTCCKLASEGWACCPLPNAVCCSDGEHCCPEGYTCDTSGGTCKRGMKTAPMLVKTLALKKTAQTGVVCPGGESQCPDDSTCCKLSSGEYGCCPLPNAVCCSDGEHCCPEGYTCDVSAGTCNHGRKTIALLHKIPAIKKIVKANIVCPDGSKCPSGSTCCQIASGGYGCCPLPGAVCCSDKVHCCPHGYTCDTASGTCQKGMKTVPMLVKTAPLEKTAESNVICPDGKSQCPDGTTCCKLSSGEYGCCPLPNAVCCSDGEHCCPEGYTCDTSAGTCERGMKTVPMLVKTAPLEKTAESNVICPDGTSQCPDGTTCCKLSSGEYGCCPLPNAVCCSDGEHCCPEGYTCDTSAGTCERGMKTAPMLVKTAALKKTAQTGVVCPGGESQCPDDSTCCKLSSGEYGCCPLPNAVCCSDGEHCCPEGYTCDVSAGTCNHGRKTIALLHKIPAIKKIVKANIVCPDGSKCPSGSTCCQIASGGYGCCPLPDAVCCSDKVHCCPHGYTCDTASGTCQKGMKTVPMLVKTALLEKTAESNVICPDGKSQCPDGTTCCKLSSGEYGCCPLPNAVCCSDGEHCCPEGYTCDVSAGTCNHGRKTIALLHKIPAIMKIVKANIACPDGSKCPSGSTCCQIASGGYGCCPLPDAVCCSDKVHCCPHGYTCDTASGTCQKGMKTVPMLVKTAPSEKTAESNVICPDGKSQCPDGTTCCKLSSGEYGCCPLPNAVCCNDGEHCCPEGYTCDTSAGTCERGMKTVPMLVKTAPLEKTAESNVICPDGTSQCPDGTTCCKLSSGEYGCCPLPNAVCCSDGEHCCPEGYTCDTSAGTCERGMKTVLILVKTAPLEKTAESNVICPDGTSQCPDGTTCCKLSSGEYGCCPLPNAVCCNDGEHCCPEGYTCDTSAGTCERGMKTVPMLVKTAPLEKTAESNVICPDGTSQCPDGTTCCKLSSGEYGCCPLPNAVCCSDGEHCCPEGYTCDTSAGTCERGMKTVLILVKTAALKKTAQTGVVCPDGESQCPDDSTCCKLSSGEYGCCPLPNAVCCSDGEHCCPEGYTCDTSAGTCNRGMKTAPMLVKIPALKKTVKVKMLQNNERRVQSFIGAAGVSGGVDTNSSGPVICPDKMYQCPDGNTCCKLHSGSYGCCPIEKAICCNDDKHCCPQGYKCDVKKGKCNKEGEQVSMIDNIPAVLEETDASPSYIECADGSKCLDYETCCEMSDGSYGCCPMPNAFCCEDKEHCCPRGYRCDRRSQSCVSGSKHVPMLTKTKSAHYRKTQEEAVDKKLHFSPGRPKDGKSVQSVDWL